MRARPTTFIYVPLGLRTWQLSVALWVNPTRESVPLMRVRVFSGKGTGSLPVTHEDERI
jgi:hypothetical protein